MAVKFKDLITKTTRSINSAELFSKQGPRTKQDILNSILDMSPSDFSLNWVNIAKIIPLSSQATPDQTALFAKIIYRAIEQDSLRIKKIPEEQLQQFSVAISEAAEKNPLARSEFIASIPEDKLSYFTDVINKIIKRALDSNNLTKIIEAIPEDKLSLFYESIKEVITRQPAICADVLSIIPNDQMHHFYETIHKVIKADQKFNEGRYSQDILASTSMNSDELSQKIAQLESNKLKALHTVSLSPNGLVEVPATTHSMTSRLINLFSKSR